MWAVIGLANGGQSGLGDDAVWEINVMGKAEFLGLLAAT